MKEQYYELMYESIFFVKIAPSSLSRADTLLAEKHLSESLQRRFLTAWSNWARKSRVLKRVRADKLHETALLRRHFVAWKKVCRME